MSIKVDDVIHYRKRNFTVVASIATGVWAAVKLRDTPYTPVDGIIISTANNDRWWIMSELCTLAPDPLTAAPRFTPLPREDQPKWIGRPIPPAKPAKIEADAKTDAPTAPSSDADPTPEADDRGE